MFAERPYTIESDYIKGLKPIEAYDFLKHQEINANYPDEVKKDLNSVHLDAASWLPYASESYKISPDLRDYIITSVTIMYSDLPNRNGIGFPFDELSSWNSDTGMISYKTWTAKPTFVEHNNKQQELAKGVILASSMYRIPRFQGNLFAVSLLLGFDRSKDKDLTNQILSGDRPAYSMGAICQDYICNICESRYSKGGCNHFKLGQPRVNVVNGKMAYLQAHNFIGIECSSVAVPAYFQARNFNRPMLMG